MRVVDSARVSERHRAPYGLQEQLIRVLWAIVHLTLFRFSPRLIWWWRNWVLRAFGARISSTARIHPTVKIVFPIHLTIGANTSVGDRAILYALGPITLGDRVTVSQYAHVCAGSHDYTQPDMPLIRSPILVDDDAWIAADAFVGPGVTVGEGAIVGARGVATKDIHPWTVVAGNPAVFVKSRKSLFAHQRAA